MVTLDENDLVKFIRKNIKQHEMKKKTNNWTWRFLYSKNLANYESILLEHFH